MLRLGTLLPAFAVFSILWGIVLVSVGAPWDPAFIKNPDAMVRLERVRQLMDTGHWFDQVLARVGSVDHLVLHWTRPLDILVASFAWITHNWFADTQALILSGVIAGLALGLVGLVFVARLPTLFNEHHPVALGAGALFIALSPHFFFVFAPPSWPDHHGLMLIVFIASLLSGHRMLTEGNRRWTWAFGLCQAIGVWISLESLLAVAALQTGIGLIWMMDGVPDTSRLMRQTSHALLFGLLFALGIEYGPEPPGFALDRLSWFTIAIAICLTLMWHLFHALQSQLAKPRQRLSLAIGAAVLSGGVLILLNPHALGGPMAEADPWFVKTWIPFFSDGFWVRPKGATITYITALVCALLWTRQEQAEARTPWVVVYVLPSFVIFSALSMIHSSRWMPYAEIIAMPMIVVMFAKMGRDIMKHPTSLVRISLSLSTAVGFLILVNVYLLTDTLFPKERTERNVMSAKQCALDNLVNRLNILASKRGPQRILGYANITPSLLLHTPHRVQAIPIHPDAKAVHHSVNVFITSAHQPAGIDADYIVMCTVGHERIAFGDLPQALYSRLMRGDTIEGFQEIMPVRKAEEFHYQIFQISPAVQTNAPLKRGS